MPEVPQPPQQLPAALEDRDSAAAPEQPHSPLVAREPLGASEPVQSPLVTREPHRELLAQAPVAEPAPKPPAPVQQPPASPPAIAPHGRAALIVDDSRMIRRVSRQILEQLGYTVHEAENGQEALNRCKVAMPDAILLDWNMPVMTGMEFVAALRAAPGGAHPRVVFCTTNSGEPAIREALASGADGYVVKPFTAQALEAQLQRVRAG